MSEPQGPDYRPYAQALLEASASLALEVRKNRGEIVGINGQAPELVVNLHTLRVAVTLRLDEKRVVVIDEFTIDPQAPSFGKSEIRLLPGLEEADEWH